MRKQLEFGTAGVTMAVEIYEEGEVTFFVRDRGVDVEWITLSRAEFARLALALHRFLPVRPHPPRDLKPEDCFEQGAR